MYGSDRQLFTSISLVSIFLLECYGGFLHHPPYQKCSSELVGLHPRAFNTSLRTESVVQ